MSWQIFENPQKWNRPPMVTISPDRISFNSTVMKDLFRDREKVVVYFNREAKKLAFVPVHYGEKAMKLWKSGRGAKGRYIPARDILKTWNIRLSRLKKYSPHWDENKEWLVIQLDGEVEDK